MKFRKPLAALVCLSLVSISVFASPKLPFPALQNQEDQKLKKKLEQKALAMLDQLVEESASFKLPENRAHVLLTAADLLWRFDEKRARSLFVEVTTIFQQMAQMPDDAPETIPENFRWRLSQMRQQAVQVIAGHDAQLAGNFLTATRPNGKDPAYNAENETQLELMVTQQLARQDPKQALQAAKEKLAAAKNPNVVSGILSELRQKDMAAAQELLEVILGRLRSEGRLGPESASFALSLLSYLPNPARENASQSDDQSPPMISPVVARELIEKAAAAALADLTEARKQNNAQRKNNALSLLQNLKSLMPYIEKYAPATAVALKRSFPESERLMDDGQRQWNELNTLTEKGSPDLLIEAAAKAGPEMQFNYYQRAAQIARDKGNPEIARQLINEHIPEGPLREQALRELDQQRLWQSINSGNFEDAQGLIASVRTAQERVSALIQLSGNVLNAGKKELAAQMLDQAWELVAGPAETNQQLASQLQIAGVYAGVNPARSFEIIEATIDQYNELFTAAALVESFNQQGSFRNKEMVLGNVGGSLVTPYLYAYAQSLAGLSRTDLERAQVVIGRFARPEVRAGIRLVLLQHLLRSETVGVGPGIGFSIGRGIGGGN